MATVVGNPRPLLWYKYAIPSIFLFSVCIYTQSPANKCSVKLAEENHGSTRENTALPTVPNTAIVSKGTLILR